MEIAKLGQFHLKSSPFSHSTWEISGIKFVRGSRSIRLLGCVLADFEMQIKIGLPNGRSEKITVPLSSRVGDLKLLALDLLARGFLRTVTAEGRPLVAEETLEAAGVQEGDYLTFIAVEAKEGTKVATERAFALLRGDRAAAKGAIQTLVGTDQNHPATVLPSWQMAGLLPGAIQILVAIALLCKIYWQVCSMFRPLNAPLLQFWQMDRRLLGAIQIMVVTTCDNSQVQQLTSVQQIQATRRAFAARFWWQLFYPRSSCVKLLIYSMVRMKFGARKRVEMRHGLFCSRVVSVSFLCYLILSYDNGNNVWYVLII